MQATLHETVVADNPSETAEDLPEIQSTWAIDPQFLKDQQDDASLDRLREVAVKGPSSIRDGQPASLR